MADNSRGTDTTDWKIGETVRHTSTQQHQMQATTRILSRDTKHTLPTIRLLENSSIV